MRPDHVIIGSGINALVAGVLHCGLRTVSANARQTAKVVAFALDAASGPIVKDGAGKAVEALRMRIEEQGEGRTGADADRILVREGRVTGVALASGEKIACGAVLASLAPGQLQGRLLREVNLPEVRLAARGMWPAVPAICVWQPHRLDASRCPAGKAILGVKVPDAPRVINGDAGSKISGTDGKSVRDAFADRIEKILAQHIKGFYGLRLARRAYSPADLEALNVNSVGGDPYGGTQKIHANTRKSEV